MANVANEYLESCHVKFIGPDMPYHLATVFFAILAYPSKTQYDQRDNLVDALTAWRSKNARKRHYLDRKDIPKKLMDIPNQQIRGRINRANDRILKRMQAADILRHINWSELAELSVEDGFAKKMKLYFPIKNGRMYFPEKRKRLSRTSIIEDYSASRGQDSSYIKQAVWMESVPVIHLAHHFQDALNIFARKSVEFNNKSFPVPWNLPYILMAADDWIFDCAQRAESTRFFNSIFHDIDLSRTIKLSFEKP